MLTTLGEMLNLEHQAEAILTDIDQTLEEQRTRLAEAGMNQQPVALVNFLDD